jgi:hypothetical protein
VETLLEQTQAADVSRLVLWKQPARRAGGLINVSVSDLSSPRLALVGSMADTVGGVEVTVQLKRDQHSGKPLVTIVGPKGSQQYDGAFDFEDGDFEVTLVPEEYGMPISERLRLRSEPSLAQ